MSYNSNIDKNTPILIIGAGSIGERHIRNLHLLGYTNLIVYRQRNLPFRDINTASPTVYTDWEYVIRAKPKIAFICTVTHLHLSFTTKCIEMGMHVLVEKPLSHTCEGLEKLGEILLQQNRYLHVGYMMRFHPLVQRIKNIIDSQQYGQVISIQSKWAEYLPDWHPWENYRESYAAKKTLGGGVALTLSHDIDQVCFLLGALPQTWHKTNNYKNKLDIDVEATTDILLSFESGTTANIHLSYAEKTKERFLKVVFDNATVEFNFFSSTLTIKQPKDNTTVETLTNFDRNDLFISQTKYFLQKITHFTPDEVQLQISTSQRIITICNH